MRHTVVYSLLIPLAIILASGSWRAALAQASGFADEISRQTAIYQSRGDNTPEGYIINRSLMSYLFLLPPEFTRSLAALGPEHRWLDIGAGEGRAVLDYCTSRYDVMLRKAYKRAGGKARAVAMSVEDRRTAQWHKVVAALEDPDQIRYLAGRRLREYSRQELGQFQVVSDVFGGFSYSQDLALFVEKTLDFLAVDGTFYTVLQDVRTENANNVPYYPNSPFLTEIQDTDGSELSVCNWLKRIGCAEVSCEAKPNWSPPVEVYRVRKVCDKISVPALAPLHFQAGTPPERRYRVRVATPRTNGR